MMRGAKGGARTPMAKPQNAKKTISRLMGYVSHYRLQLLIVLLCILTSAIVSAVSAGFIQTLIDDYILPLIGVENPSFAPLLGRLAVMAVLYVLGILAALFNSRIMARVGQKVLYDVRIEMFSHMQKLPLRYFDTHSHGEVMSTYTNDTDTLRQMVTMAIPNTLSSIISVIAVFVEMLFQSLWLTIAVVLFTILIVFFTTKIAVKSGKYFGAQQRALASLNGYIEEMINGQKVVKVFNHEDESEEGFTKRNDELCHNATSANKFANIIGPVNNNMGHILYVLLAVIGAALSIAHVPNVSLSGSSIISLGTIAAFLTLSRSFVMPISQISQQIASVVTALAGAERIFALMDEEPEVDDGYVVLVNAVKDADGNLTECKERTGIWAWKHPHQDGTITYSEVQGDIRLIDVDFGYVPEKIVLHDINIFAKPGQKIALVGSTGAGKTTITNLLTRFYDIADGKIRYDGINIKKIHKDDLRHSLGMVLQEVNLFTGTVMENLRFGKPTATDEECIAAAKLAGADSFIRMLPEGYNTILSGDGSGLSQGQRQLLSIARAAVEDPPVMILDEATSSIDTRTEAIVQRGMDALMAGRTVFVIAHRLSTVRNANAIMVMEHGRIIERGDHDTLLAQKGTYYQLYTGAFDLD